MCYLKVTEEMERKEDCSGLVEEEQVKKALRKDKAVVEKAC